LHLKGKLCENCTRGFTSGQFKQLTSA